MAEVLEVANTMENEKILTDLVNEYEVLKDDYFLQGARKQMLDSFISGKFEVDERDPVNTTIQRDIFLSKAKELSDEINSLNMANEIKECDEFQLDGHIQMELNRGQVLLKKILEEQVTVEASIIASRKQIEDMNAADIISHKENEAPKNGQKFVEITIDDEKLQNVQKLQRESEALFAGLKTLTGVKAFEVTESGEKGGVKLLITVGDISVALTLDAEKRICDIKILSGKSSLDLPKLLGDSRVLPCPQDLRYAVFAVGASQHAAESVRNHLPELRKTCIVKILSPLRFELGLPNSVTAIVSIHECYPEVPSGVHIESLLGMEEGSKEITYLESLKTITNSRCFRTIPDMFSYLKGPYGLNIN